MSSADLDETDVEAVLGVVRSGRLALGPKMEEFERRLAAYVGVDHAVAVSSGTTALHLILRALEVQPGDEIIVPSFTFAASVNAILYERAVPVFVDIEPETYNLDPGQLEQAVGPRTRALMAVDVFGHPADWDAVERFALQRGLVVVDDSCEALGAEYKGRKVGGFGEAAAFAFYPNKQMTTGEGGMIATNNAEIAKVARSLRNQGRDEHGAWLSHERLGFNYRMDEMSAALGCSQIQRLDSFVAKRERVARAYTARLEKVEGVRVPQVSPDVRMSWFVYVVTLAPGIDRDRVMAAMETRGVAARSYFPPVHLQPYMRYQQSRKAGELRVTEDVGSRTLALPFHNNLSEEEAEIVASALEESIAEGRIG